MACCGNARDGQDFSFLKRKACILCKAWHVLTREPKRNGDPCIVIPARLARKPDPCIYSQFMLLQAGMPVTWDNPDVRIFRGGVEQDTYNLSAGVEYDIEITVHNASRNKPANGTGVDVKWIEFGAGSQTRHPVATLTADVPVWPGVAVASTKWRTPVTPGHYCIEVDLSHPDDGNPANNRGWNNTQVHAANSPVDRPIRIFNSHPGECPPVAEGGGPTSNYRGALAGWGTLGALAAILYGAGAHDGIGATRLAVAIAGGYVAAAVLGLMYYRMHNDRQKQRPGVQVPTVERRIDCHLVQINVDSYRFDDAKGKEFDPDAAFAETAPLWPAHVDPPSFVFLPGEAFRDVMFHTDAPDEPGPPGHFNINVRQGGEPSGGVTLTVTRGG